MGRTRLLTYSRTHLTYWLSAHRLTDSLSFAMMVHHQTRSMTHWLTYTRPSEFPKCPKCGSLRSLTTFPAPLVRSASSIFSWGPLVGFFYCVLCMLKILSINWSGFQHVTLVWHIGIFRLYKLKNIYIYWFRAWTNCSKLYGASLETWLET